MITKRTFLINSRERLSGTDGKFETTLDFGAHPKFNRICCQQVQIPKSYYLVQAGFNTFTLTENGVSTTVALVPGNYSAASFVALLPPLLNAASIVLGHTWAYAVTFPGRMAVVTNKFTFTVTGNGGLQPSFSFYNNLFEQFGFNNNSTAIFAANTLTSLNVIKFQLEDTIYVHCSLCSNGLDDILEVVFAGGVPDGAAMTHETTQIEYSSKTLVTNTSASVTFKLTDEDGTPIELNGLNWNMKIIVWTQ